jgi:hypothetical protein
LEGNHPVGVHVTDADWVGWIISWMCFRPVAADIRSVPSVRGVFFVLDAVPNHK